MKINSKSKAEFLALAAATLTIGTSATAAVTTIYSHDFSGGTAQLNGASVTTGVGTWVANSVVTQAGVTGAGEGSALLPFDPVIGEIYTLSLDVNHSGGSAWVGLGFARDALGSVGASLAGERFTNNPEGISWFLYRDDSVTVGDVADDIQIFGGLRTANGIADTNTAAYVSGVSQTLTIVIDTAGDGSSFTADYFVEGVSLLSSGPATISQNIDDLNFAGITIDGSGASHTIDNFSLTSGVVPEPSIFALVGLGGLALLRRRR